jgi:hypothetical protein
MVIIILEKSSIKLAQGVKLLAFIPGITGSNLGRDTDLCSVQGLAIFLTPPGEMPVQCLRLCHYNIGITPQLLTALLNKLQINK